MTATNYLRSRWNKELKYWHLRWWQLVLLVLWSAWSLICGWLFPAHPELWLFPQAPFLAFGYLGGGLFMAIFPGQPWAYPLGLCFTVFLLTYLALVSWRWHRDNKRPNPSLQRDAPPENYQLGAEDPRPNPSLQRDAPPAAQARAPELER